MKNETIQLTSSQFKQMKSSVLISTRHAVYTKVENVNILYSL